MPPSLIGERGFPNAWIGKLSISRTLKLHPPGHFEHVVNFHDSILGPEYSTGSSDFGIFINVAAPPPTATPAAAMPKSLKKSLLLISIQKILL
jgi:hypothetical protein